MKGIPLLALVTLAFMSPIALTLFSKLDSNHHVFSERRAGATRQDVRNTLREAESNVPTILNDAESRVSDIMADVERQMMKDADKYGMSKSDIRSQMRDMEQQTKQRIRDMEPDVRNQIRSMEEPVWDELREVERRALGF